MTLPLWALPATPAAAFDPNTLDNIVLYLDAGQGMSLDGGGLATDWLDVLIGSTNDFAQPTEPNRPLFIANGSLNNAPCVKLQDAARLMTAASVAGLADGDFITSLWVFRPYAALTAASHWWRMTKGGATQLDGKANADVWRPRTYITQTGTANVGTIVAGTDGGLLELKNNGTSVIGEWKGSPLSASPVADSAGIDGPWDGMGFGSTIGTSSEVELYLFACFASSSSGDPLSAGDRTTLLTEWNSITGLSMT